MNDQRNLGGKNSRSGKEMGNDMKVRGSPDWRKFQGRAPWDFTNSLKKTPQQRRGSASREGSIRRGGEQRSGEAVGTCTGEK